MPQNVLPEFKGAIYNATKTEDTDFFATDLEPTVTPSVFLIYFVRGSTTNVPKMKRTNGANTVLERIFPGTISDEFPYTRQVLVAPGDTINFKTMPASGNTDVKTLIVVEMEVGAIPAPHYNATA